MNFVYTACKAIRWIFQPNSPLIFYPLSSLFFPKLMSQFYSYNRAWGIPKHLKGLHDLDSLLDPPMIPLNSVGETLHRAIC